MANVVALLESMWGWRGCSDPGDEVPYFRINPENLSGKRLYRVCGEHSLLVTNSCRVVQAKATDHGVPDPEWVHKNLSFLKSQKMDLLLVCGRVAFETYRASGFDFAPVIYMNHPAWRLWSNAALARVAAQVSIALEKRS